MIDELRRAGELTCSCMCGRFELAQPTISHHIKTLESSGIIRVRREGAFHVLSVDERVLSAFVSSVRGDVGVAGGVSAGAGAGAVAGSGRVKVRSSAKPAKRSKGAVVRRPGSGGTAKG